MASRWELTDQARQKYTPLIEEFIEELESNEDPELSEIDLSDSELNPYTLQKLLESMGYEHEDTDTNGWQWDFWTIMTKDGFRDLMISGTGITFELKLSDREV